MNKKILASECFSNKDMHFFIDFCQSVNDRHFITITRSDYQHRDGSYKRRSVTVFEDDFEFLIMAFSSVFRSVVYRQELRENPQRTDVRTTGMKSWDADCRPREKMMDKGVEAMADAELLAMLIGSGTPGETAVALAGRILCSVDYSLDGLAGLSMEALCSFHGMGNARASCIIAAMELANRRVKGRHKPVWLKAL
jgi:DNA repair protein RadC